MGAVYGVLRDRSLRMSMKEGKRRSMWFSMSRLSMMKHRSTVGKSKTRIGRSIIVDKLGSKYV